jgi:uncharacterized protein
MEELVKFIVDQLVDDPSAVEVKSSEEDGILVINVIAEKEQIGKIIGKQGRIAKAIRTIVKAGANRSKIKVSVEIIEK